MNVLKSFVGLGRHFFLNKNINNDCVLLKSKSGVNFLLISVRKIKELSLLYMNYLAHAYLSFNDPGILAGNMISDYVKGKKQFDYPAQIQKGIQLHRAIDHFTDTHDVTQQLKSYFRPHYRLYSGAFADVVYDHFLANDQQQFETENDLQQFSLHTYRLLDGFFPLFPPAFQQTFPYMKTYDWLFNYRHAWGIEKSFNGLVRRSVYLTESAKAFEIFKRNYHDMQQCYALFFPALKKFSRDKLDELLKN